MKAGLLLILAGCLIFSAPGGACAGELSSTGQPPVVVATVPQAGDSAVDPDLQQIKIVFSKSMQTNSWSLVMQHETSFPKIAGQVGFLEDRRTFIAPVKLEPAKNYVVWINSKSHHNFRGQGGRPAVPYLLSFQTRP